MKCPYCESGTNDFVPMNQTAEYSGIEMSVNRQGMLRVRVLDDDGGLQPKTLSRYAVVRCAERDL